MKRCLLVLATIVLGKSYLCSLGGGHFICLGGHLFCLGGGHFLGGGNFFRWWSSFCSSGGHLFVQVVVIAVKPHLYTEVLHKLAGEGRR